MICKSCKRDILENSIYCSWCGKKLLKDANEFHIPAPRKLSSGKWFIQLRMNGRSVSITENTEKACRAKAQATKAGLLDAKRNHRLTLGETVDKYIESRSNTLSPNTIKGYWVIRNNRFQRYMAKNADSIDFQRMVNDEALLCSAKTLKNAWGLVRAALEAQGIACKATTPSVPKVKRPWLAPDEILAFVELVKDKPCALPALLALHSLRRSEVFALTWENVDLKKKQLQVSGSAYLDDEGKLTIKPTNKTEASNRTVPILIPALYDLLSAVPADERQGTVCHGHINVAYTQINALCERNALPLVGMHGLRHSFASLGYYLQIGELDIMRMGGWSDYGVVHKIYTHLSQQGISAGVEKLQAFFSETLANKNANKS